MRSLISKITYPEIWIGLGAATLFKINALSYAYFWDELLVYAAPAHWLFSHGLGKVLPGSHPPALFFGHVPGFSFFLALTFWIFGEHFFVARSAMLVLSLIQLYFTFRIGALWSRWAGMIAAALLFSVPTFFSHSTQVLGDVAVSSLGTSALYFALKRESKPYSLLACLTALMKETSLAFTFPLLILELWRQGAQRRFEFRNFLLFGIPVLITPLFFLSERLATGAWSNFPFQHTVNLNLYGILGRATTYLKTGFWHSPVWVLCTIATLGFFMILLWPRSKQERWREVALLGVFICNILGIACFTWINYRYFLPVFPILCIFSAVGLWRLCIRPQIACLFAAAIIGWFARSYYGQGRAIGNSWEDTMQYPDIIEVQKQAIQYTELAHPGARIFAVWPMDAEISDSFFGYTTDQTKSLVVGRNAAQEKGDYAVLIRSESSVPDGYRLQTDEIVTEKLHLEKKFEKNGKIAEVWVKSEAQI